MAGVFPFIGKEDQLQRILAAPFSEEWFMGLFVNPDPPALLDWVFATLSPASFSGYAGEQQMVGWGSIYTYAARDKASDATALVWAHDGGSGGNVIKGWYIRNVNTNALVWVEFFDTPVDMLIFGDIISLKPTIVLGKLLP